MSKEQEGHTGSSREKPTDYVLIGYGDYGRHYVLPGVVQAVERHLAPADLRVVVVDRNEPAPGAYPEIGSFVQMDLGRRQHYGRLRERLGDGTGRRRVFHFAVAPALYRDVARGLKASGLAHGDVLAVIEKPVGNDGPGSRKLQAELEKAFGAEQVVYSDHYLAKAALAGMRSAFREIDPARVAAIRVATLEERGIAGRGRFYDATGALRDVTCHLLKVAATALGEPTPDAAASRTAFCRRLQVVDAVRAQYVEGAHMVGYLSEWGVSKKSTTETYVALALRIVGGRWHGVPLLFEAGKASVKRKGEVRVEFKDPGEPARSFDLHHRGPDDVLDHTRLVVAACWDDRDLWAHADELAEEWRLIAQAQARPGYRTLHRHTAGTLRPEAARRLFPG